MKKTKNIKDFLHDYRTPVTETEWQIIVNNKKVVRYNGVRHALQVIKYPAILLCSIAIIVSLIVFVHRPHQKQVPPGSNKTPIQISQPNPPASPPDMLSEPLQKFPSNTASTPVAPSTPLNKISPISSNEQSSITEMIAPNKAQTSPALLADTAQDLLPDSSRTSPSPAISSTPILPINDTNFVEDTGNLTFPITPSDEQIQTIDHQLFIPSAFTPNGDGLNDRFVVKANFQPFSFDMTIFTKDGQKVFNTRDIEIGWDGLCRGQQLPQDIYFYLIRYIDLDGKAKMEKGQLLLIK